MRIGPLHFAHPLWLLVGCLAAAAVLALSVQRGTRLDTAYLDLWERALAETSLAERLLQRLSNLFTALLAAACLAVSAAAAGPSREVPGPRDVLFVVDRSATMAANVKGLSRLDLAKAWIERQVDRLDELDAVGLATVGREVELLVPPGLDRAHLKDRLRSIEIEPAHSDLTAAEPLDFGRVGRRKEGATSHARIETLLVSDLVAGKRRFAKTKVVGEPLPNVGITALRVSDPFPEAEVSIEVLVENAGDSNVERRLVVSRGKEEVTSQAVSVPAKGSARTALSVPRGPGGLAGVALTPGDGFALDDEATFLLTPASAASLVIVKTEDGPSKALEAAVRSLADEFDVKVGVTTAGAGPYPAGAVVVQEGGVHAPVAERALLLGAVPEGLARAAAPGSAPRPILTFRGDHPLLRGLRLDALIGVRQVNFGEGWVELAHAEDGPVIAVSRESREAGAAPRRLVAVSTRLEGSNFVTLDGGFPVFLRRGFLWLTGGGEKVLAATRSGDDPLGPLSGRPVEGPRAFGPWTLPSGVASTASLLDRATLDLTPGEVGADPVFDPGDPTSETLGAPFAWTAAALFAAALFVEIAALVRESDATLSRRAKAL